MSKQKGKTIKDEKSYILRIREMEISVEDKQRSISQDMYHSLDEIKDVIKSDIAESRLGYLANYEMAENGLSSDVFIGENNCLVHSVGNNMYPECTNIYYEVVDKEGNVVDIDWSDTIEYFNKNSPIDLCVNETRQKGSLSEQRGQQAETKLGSVDITEEAECPYLK